MIVTCVNNLELQGGGRKGEMELDIGIFAPGYAIHYVLFLLLFILVVVHDTRSQHMQRTVPGHKATLPRERMTQLGFRFGKVGLAVKVMCVSFLLWVQLTMFITIGAHYDDKWVWTPGETRSANWDSFARAFLMAWMTTLIAVGVMVSWKERAKTFFMMPCPLSEASHVSITKEDTDESGNLVTSHYLCRVTRLFAGPRMIEVQLLRYPYCSVSGAYTLHPVWGELPGADRFPQVALDEDITGEWAKAKLVGGGMDSAQAVHACEGVQGANEITVDVPSFGASCVEEFWTAFYVYQIYAGLICFFWDFISVGLMMMLLVFASGLFKVVTERMQRLKLKRMASIDANVWAKRDGGWLKVHCRQLCVGDLLCVTSDGADPTKTVSADCVLVKGNCVVDESFLTGETMPIQKFEADGDAKPVLPTESGHKKYFIFSGTDLLDASGGGSDLPAGVERGALAVVTHTGGRSTRGSLLRGLLFATPLKLQFVSETKLVLVLLVVIAMVDFTIVNIKYSFSMSSIMTALFMVISVVNPLLSVAVLGGQVASARRLASDSGRNKRKRSIIKMPKMQGRGGEEDEGEGDVEMGSVGAKFGSHPSASDGGSEPQSKIFVRDVDRMALAGRVDLICFDKTGTITKSGLDFVGAVGVSQRRQPGSAGGDDGGKLKGLIGYDGRRPEGFDIPEELASALALTHTVSRLGDRKIGHQVELRMVEAAESLGWTYSQDMRTVSTWQVEEQWTFDHHTMTMSVLCTVPEREEAWVFCKGSFEAVSGLCTRCESPSSGDAESGQDWREVLEELAELSESLSTKGCYVLAVARKRVPFSTISKVTRSTAERDLSMVGLFVFRNEPKHDSADAMSELRRGGIDCVMVTGDSALTGAAVARTVGIVPKGHKVLLGSVSAGEGGRKGGEIEWREIAVEEGGDAGGALKGSEGVDGMEMAGKNGVSNEELELTSDGDCVLAVTGDAFSSLLDSDRIEELVTCRGGAGCVDDGLGCKCARIKIFGRMGPHHKVQCVRLFAGLGHTVGMCGDGGNDSGALRAAHTGLALSGRAEASVAAPFSTGEESLSAMVLLLREGRASLCTSFAAYRFLVVRGIVWTQVKNVTLLIYRIYMSPLAYLFCDLLAISSMLWCITQARPAARLAPRLPEGSLLGPLNVVSGSISCFLALICVSSLFSLLSSQGWYLMFDGGSEQLSAWQARSDNFEAPLVFLWFAYFNVELALVFSTGHIHREPVHKNTLLMGTSAFLLLCIMILLYSQETTLSCMFKVNCDEFTYQRIRDHWINTFLFSYEQVGGIKWHAPSREVGGSPVSTNYPGEFKASVTFLLIFFSIVHALLYKYVVLGTFCQEWCPRVLGWGDKTGVRLIDKLKRGRAKARRLKRRMRRMIGLRQRLEDVQLDSLPPGIDDAGELSPGTARRMVEIDLGEVDGVELGDNAGRQAPVSPGENAKRKKVHGVYMEDDCSGMMMAHDSDASLPRN